MVLVALQDGLLDATFSELKAQFPEQSFRKVCLVILCMRSIRCQEHLAQASITHPTRGLRKRLTKHAPHDISGFNVVWLQIGVNLGKPGYLEQIDQETKDIDVQLVFNNAGYMLTGFFEST